MDSLKYDYTPYNAFLELGIKENIDRLKIIEMKLNKLINEGGGLGSNQYNDLNNNFTGQLQTLTTEFNNQITALEKKIPSLPISSDNVNYTDFYNNKTKLDFYLKNVDVFRSQALWILNNLTEDIKNFKTQLFLILLFYLYLQLMSIIHS
jgi:hypothetical protein